MVNALNWFELPTADFDRAVTFYNAILDSQLQRVDFMGVPNAFFPYQQEGGVGGALIYEVDRKPTSEGARIFLNVNDKLDAVLSRIEMAGGSIVLPKTDIGQPGLIALIIDSEGNLVGRGGCCRGRSSHPERIGTPTRGTRRSQ